MSLHQILEIVVSIIFVSPFLDFKRKKEPRNKRLMPMSIKVDGEGRMKKTERRSNPKTNS